MDKRCARAYKCKITRRHISLLIKYNKYYRIIVIFIIENKKQTDTETNSYIITSL